MKKKLILLSAIVSSQLFAQDVVLDNISVTEEVNKKVVESVDEEEIKSADLAEALSQNIPSVSIVRRSGIANDIILRGQKKDNINVLIDGCKIYGGCPNRMDPPTSHVLTNNIDSVEVIEGPYDVENFGTLSGKVVVNTKDPSKDFKGEINLNTGSFNYKKVSTTVSGGTDRFKLLISASTESSDQYEDGNGNNFYEQQVSRAMPAANRLTDPNEEAYEKKTLLSKMIFNIDDSSEIKLSYTANRSDNVIYPNTPMDADYDDSDIYNLTYEIRDIGEYSKKLNLDLYYSYVDHPMSTTLRNNAVASSYKTNHMESSIWGTKLKNGLDTSLGYLTLGIDVSERNWKGQYEYLALPTTISLTSTDTLNKAFFSKLEQKIGNFNIDYGMRYDNTDIDALDGSYSDKNYDDLSANIFAVYNSDEDTKYFAGLGKSIRVPDARELYYSGAVGNDSLEETKNYEVDLGFEKTIGNFKIKSKLFYSILEDYIYYNSTAAQFENINARIYGADISGFYFLNDSLSFDYGIAYQRGEKSEALTGQTDKDLAEVTPLKGNLALNYEYSTSKVSAEMIAVDRWSNFDDDNGEQELGGYAVFNLKYKNEINKNIELTLGVDNIFDKTYASSNTYKDLTLVVSGGESILMNDPGRYAYVNLRIKF